MQSLSRSVIDAKISGKKFQGDFIQVILTFFRSLRLCEWPLAPSLPLGFSDFCKKTAVFVCLTNALAPPPIALESCSTAETDRPV